MHVNECYMPRNELMEKSNYWVYFCNRWMCLRVAGPAAVEGVVSQRGAMQQAGVGAVSVALVFSCCQLHVSALSRSLEKV